MPTSYYEHGVTAALTELRLQKTSGILPRGLKRLIPQITQRASKFGPQIEKQVYKVLPGAKPYLKGVPGQALRETVLGAGFGGALGAPIGAMTAEPGERGSGALQGAISGVGQGALWGGVSALVRGPIQNIARNRLTQMAQHQGHSAQQAANIAKKEYDTRSWFGNVKDTVTGKGALGRKGSAIAAAGGAAGFGLGDIYAPSLLDPSTPNAPEPPSRVTTADDKSDEKSLIPARMLGSYLGGLSTNIGIRALKHSKRLPFQKKLSPFALEVLPIVLTSAGAASGYVAAKKINQLQKRPSTKNKK